MFKKTKESQDERTYKNNLSINRKITYIQEIANRKYNNSLEKILKFSLENSLERLNIIFEQAERISELKKKSVEIDYPVKEHKGKTKQNEQNLRDLWDIKKYTKTCTPKSQKES